MSKSKQNDETTTEPLYKRETAPVDRADDVILLVLAEAEKPLDPREVYDRAMDMAADVFEQEIDDTNGFWECKDSLDMFEQLDYTNGSPFLSGETEVSLAPLGLKGVEALRAGLSEERRNALAEWSESIEESDR